MKKDIRKQLHYFLIVTFITLSGSISFAQAPDSWVLKKDYGTTSDSVYGAVAFSIGNKGYMGTGYSKKRLISFWEYDPNTDTWSQKANFSGTARVFASGFSIGNKGYVGCGDDNNTANLHGSKDFWQYDPALNQWNKKSDFGGVPRRGAVGFSIGNKGYLGAGRIDEPKQGAPAYDFKFKDFWEYDPVADKWTQKEDIGGTLGKVIAFPAGFAIGNKGYVGTGHDLTSYIKDFWEFDPTYVDPGTNENTGKWYRKADFPGTARYGAVGMGIGEFGYIGTGMIPGGLANDLWEYDPQTDSWTRRADFGGTKRYLAAAFSIGNTGYIGTGQIDANVYPGINTKDFWQYTPAVILSISEKPGKLTEEDFSIQQNNGQICITSNVPYDAEIDLRNLMGQVIQQEQCAGNNTIKFSTNSVQHGIYIIDINYAHSHSSKKLLIN
ncbi:MAG: T9SS type A sorting domain-containing protein [Bacteroidales bacterium]